MGHNLQYTNFMYRNQLINALHLVDLFSIRVETTITRPAQWRQERSNAISMGKIGLRYEQGHRTNQFRISRYHCICCFIVGLYLLDYPKKLLIRNTPSPNQFG